MANVWAYRPPCEKYQPPTDPEFLVDGEPPCAVCQHLRAAHVVKADA